MLGQERARGTREVDPGSKNLHRPPFLGHSVNRKHFFFLDFGGFFCITAVMSKPLSGGAPPNG